MPRKDYFRFLKDEDGKINRKKLFVYLLPVLLIAFATTLKHTIPILLEFFASEDMVFETSQSILYFLSAILSFRIAKTSWKDKKWPILVLFGLLSVAFFFWAGEEISWGQRIFGIESSDHIKEINAQGETTLHNLKHFQGWLDFGFMVVGAVGTVLALLHPWLKKVKFLYPITRILPQPKHLLYFFILFLIFWTYLYIKPMKLGWLTDDIFVKELETGEFILAIAIFRIIRENYRELVKKDKNSKDLVF